MSGSNELLGAFSMVAARMRGGYATLAKRPDDGGRTLHPANDHLAQLQAATLANSDAARPLPRPTTALAEATCNGRDAVAHESAEALQRRPKVSAACQLLRVVRPPTISSFDSRLRNQRTAATTGRGTV